MASLRSFTDVSAILQTAGIGAQREKHSGRSDTLVRALEADPWVGERPSPLRLFADRMAAHGLCGLATTDDDDQCVYAIAL